MSRRVWDISERIEPGTATFPGDNPFSQEWVMRMSKGASCNVSTIRMSVHVGTHADAPLHYDSSGDDIASVDVQTYMGRCRVIEVAPIGAPPRVPADALNADALAGVERVLLRTNPGHDHKTFDPDFVSLGEEAAKAVAAAGVKLGDQVWSIDGKRVESVSRLVQLVRGSGSERVGFEFLRGEAKVLIELPSQNSGIRFGQRFLSPVFE